ncbi:MAG: hypothetical protein MZV63_33385 [Marinilabiliales bacterium]|nr:hypothetical protein [Marinilabiliales bacterium]
MPSTGHRADSSQIRCARFRAEEGVRQGWAGPGWPPHGAGCSRAASTGPAKIVHWPGAVSRQSRSWLGIKRLDDDLLNMAEALVQMGDFLQRFHPILPALANADQDAGGEWNPQPAGHEPCTPASDPDLFPGEWAWASNRAVRLQHQSHGGVIGLQPAQIVLVQQAGIGMGQADRAQEPARRAPPNSPSDPWLAPAEQDL